MRWTCDTSNITWRSKCSNDAWKCLKSALDLSDCLVLHSRLTDLPPKTPDSQTSSNGTVERSVSVEQQIAGTDVQWPPTPTWGGLSGTVERSHVVNGMPVQPTCSAPGRWRRAIMVDSSHPEGKALCCANCSHCRHFILSFVCLLTDLTVYESLLIQAFVMCPVTKMVF